MVKESQARQAAPLLKQIDSIATLLAQINAAAAAGNWKSNYIIFLDGSGQTQNLSLAGLPAADILSSLAQLAQATLTTRNNELTGI